MDLIDRDALLEQIDIDSDGNEGQYGDEWFFMDTIENAPTIEARPKGEWIWNENGMDWGLGCWCCSECGMRNPYIGSGDNALLSNPHNWAGSKYCPNCGAQMKGADDDTPVRL